MGGDWAQYLLLLLCQPSLSLFLSRPSGCICRTVFWHSWPRSTPTFSSSGSVQPTTAFIGAARPQCPRFPSGKCAGFAITSFAGAVSAVYYCMSTVGPYEGLCICCFRHVKRRTRAVRTVNDVLHTCCIQQSLLLLYLCIQQRVPYGLVYHIWDVSSRDSCLISPYCSSVDVLLTTRC